MGMYVKDNKQLCINILLHALIKAQCIVYYERYNYLKQENNYLTIK